MLRVAVTTRNGGSSAAPFGMNLSLSVGDNPTAVAANRELLATALDFDASALVLQKQVHGKRVREINAPGEPQESDAMVTNCPNILLGVSTADCQPILLYDQRTNALAAVHAGWRGMAARITTAAIDRMGILFGTEPRDLWVYVGPAAAECCYEVGDDVASQFPTFVRPGKVKGKSMLDLKAATRAELAKAGIPADHIDVSPDCTIHNADTYHSHRRDAARAGRMLGVIGRVG
jgi:hypothetical protein